MASIVKSGGVSFAISQVIIVKLFTFDACTLLFLFEFSALFICFYICVFGFWFLTFNFIAIAWKFLCRLYVCVHHLWSSRAFGFIAWMFSTPLFKICWCFLMFSSIVKFQSFPLCYLKSFDSFATNVLIIDFFNVFIKHEALGFWCVEYLQTKSLCILKAFSIWLNCPWS